jgi:rubrerythrin
MEVDETALESLLEESEDTHADAMRAAKVDLNEFVEVGLERRAQGGVDPEETTDFVARRKSIVDNKLAMVGATAGIGAAVLALSAASATAAMATDIQILQTAQSIENVAIATYKTALTLPFIGGSSANGVVKAFSMTTMAQHTDHAAAFESAITKLGGKSQTAVDPALYKLVKAAEPGLKNAAAVVALALELEEGAAQTYVANTSALRNLNARKVTASIMGVEAQHVAILLAVQALLKANDVKFIALPPAPLTGLPAAAGSLGFPQPFYLTTAARPETEGAL